MIKILIMGLPGSGKTTLADALKKKMSVVHFNADEVRKNLNKDLGFSMEDRIEQARRMGWLCDKVVESGTIAMADFVCPTYETREAFGVGARNVMTIFVDRIPEGRYPDTNKIFQKPENVDFVIAQEGSPDYWADIIISEINRKMNVPRPPCLTFG